MTSGGSNKANSNINVPVNGPIEITDGTGKVPILPSRKDVVKGDNLLQNILNDKGVFELIDIVIAELAEESASLKYERMKKEFSNEATDRISLRRANILKTISDTLVQKRNLALNDFVNLRSPQWQVVFSLVMDKVKRTFGDLGYTSEQIELYFQKLTSNLDGFEEEAELKLRENTLNLKE